jgi:ketosteroid isomerase-like protein
MSSENSAVEIVSKFLEASMKPDPVLAATYMTSDVVITFTGGRRMANASGIAQFNGARYSWVKKSVGQFDWVERGDHTVVYSNGTLYGQWPDGRPFADNRYLDRYEVKDGRITRMDVWNDSAEWILDPSINRTGE